MRLSWRVVHLPIVETDSCRRQTVFEGEHADAEAFYFDYIEREDVDEFYVVLEPAETEFAVDVRLHLSYAAPAEDERVSCYAELRTLDNANPYCHGFGETIEDAVREAVGNSDLPFKRVEE